ncbi:MAG: nicotinate-nucleotide adenylyltransferase [Proteobacteria bacterium]|nr:nicotinate-nucleotide adenylyltransferase [Pseudomonadota bacterium]
MLKLPPFGEGQRIGLFGGSFNPAHRGHYMVALYALKRLQLDWVWWLVSPQNPLKDPRETGEYEERLAYTRRIARHPRFVVSDLERQIGARYTADTLEALKVAAQRVHFVWIMGADSLAGLHRWHHWTDIVESVPLAVLARPGYSIRALQGVAAMRYADCRVSSERPADVVAAKPPAWTFVTMPLRKESSTAIRKRRKPARLNPAEHGVKS